MAVAKARQLCPIDRGVSDVSHHALVVGGGLAGMTAALSIAEQGFGVTLVERESELGGNLRHIYVPLPGEDGDPQALLQRTIEAVSADPRITVLTGAEVVDTGGYVGQYRTTVKLADPSAGSGQGGQQEEIQHGAIVVATGARQIEPQEYLYGQDERIVTQRELEAQISDPQSAIRSLQSVVMIQCVGSRDEEHPYCSRICCTEAIKNALAIKERSPETDVYILFRDVRTFGFKERYYREARRKGVVFLQYDQDQKPEAKVEDGQMRVSVVVQPEGEEFTLDADLVVLSAGIEPNVDNEALAQLVKVPLSEDGFFLEAHVKLQPLDFAADGVYLCGLAHSPRFLDETLAQAYGAAVHVVSLLAKDELDATPIIAGVDPLLCTACGLCVDVCPYNARVLEPGATCVEAIDVLCQGCGTCIVACPNKASQQKGFGTGQVYKMLDAIAVASR
jgi:heterodisulfide reductase subunit A